MIKIKLNALNVWNKFFNFVILQQIYKMHSIIKSQAKAILKHLYCNSQLFVLVNII